MLDILIENAQVVDGSGNPGYKSDIGIKDNKIKIFRYKNKSLKAFFSTESSLPKTNGFLFTTDSRIFLEKGIAPAKLIVTSRKRVAIA